MKSIRVKNYILFIVAASLCLLYFSSVTLGAEKKIIIRGAVKTPLELTADDIRAMPKFHINAVYNLEEKQNLSDPDRLIDVVDYEGVLLRDLLEKAGMTYVRKWEPAVFIRVKGADNRESVFSFGEIFYSSIGRSTLITYGKNNRLLDLKKDRLGLIVANDIRNGRQIQSVTEIIVERVDIEMKVYEERKKHIVQPPTSHFTIIDQKSGERKNISASDLTALRTIVIPDKVQAGDCEGFHDVYSYEGIPLRSLLEQYKAVTFPYHYDQFVAVSSKNGFCATYSIGELFNSRLGNNIIVAVKKNGMPLEKDEAFAMMVAEEDNTGGRSVKRIHTMTIY